MSFAANLNQDLGLLTFQVTVASGKTVREARQALDAQLDKFLQNGLTEPELAKAKNHYLTGRLFGLETMNGKASALGSAAVVLGDATRINSDLAKIETITPEQVLRALRKYVVGEKSVFIEYLPESMKVAPTPTPAAP